MLPVSHAFSLIWSGSSAREGLNVTPVRRRVLEILLESHKVIGAYDILKRLGEDGHPTQPPVAYRALDFLQTHGFVHKIERLNAFVACMHPSESHKPAFMICRNCKAVAETHLPKAIDRFNDAAKAIGFNIECAVLEIEGLCPDCQTTSS